MDVPVEIEIPLPVTVTWEEIMLLFPDQWVVLGNPVMLGTKVSQGVVIAHHADKRIASIEGGEKRQGFQKFTLVFAGKPKPVRKIGILRTLTRIA